MGRGILVFDVHVVFVVGVEGVHVLTRLTHDRGRAACVDMVQTEDMPQFVPCQQVLRPAAPSASVVGILLDSSCIGGVAAPICLGGQSVGSPVDHDVSDVLRAGFVAVVHVQVGVAGVIAGRAGKVFNVNYFCRWASIILAGSPPYPAPAAGPLRCGSWGRRIPR